MTRDDVAQERALARLEGRSPNKAITAMRRDWYAHGMTGTNRYVAMLSIDSAVPAPRLGAGIKGAGSFAALSWARVRQASAMMFADAQLDSLSDFIRTPETAKQRQQRKPVPGRTAYRARANTIPWGAP